MVIRVQGDHLHSILLEIHVHSSFATYTPALFGRQELKLVILEMC